MFEWLTGGGLYCDSAAPDDGCPIQQQGRAMLEAASQDLSKAGYRVTVPVDSRIDLELPVSTQLESVESADRLPLALSKAANEFHFIWLIAPECDGCLLQCYDWLSDFSDRFVFPDRDFIALTTCKNATAQWLEHRNVRVPESWSFESAGSVAKLPLVIKPRTGAGSDQIQFLNVGQKIHWGEPSDSFRVESFVPGVAVSVSVLCGPGANQPLLATGQRFDHQPIGHYVGATYPLPTAIGQRAQRLAEDTIRALPPTTGYVGIDMVIADQGPDFDCVIEVNPRLTMSYLKLREISGFNVAARMIEIATGTHETNERSS